MFEQLRRFRHKAPQVSLIAGLLMFVAGLGCIEIPIAAPPDHRAEQQFLPAARNGDITAQYKMGLSYRYGTSGLPKNGDEAIKWLTASANGGNSDAQFALGDIALNDEFEHTRDVKTALMWFHKAAEHSVGNRIWLAQLYKTGVANVMDRDILAAKKLLLASAKESRFACQQLGQLSESGALGAVAKIDALRWYLIAKSTTDSDRLMQMMDRESIVQAEAQAARWQP